jgi:protein gp37
MAERTGIAWTDSTFNPWIGCTKVGPGCDHCYAEALDKRHRWKGARIGARRRRACGTSRANWRSRSLWNKAKARDGKPWRVFCASLADVFDNEVPDEWRNDLWDLISETKALTWLLLTKRIGNVAKMLPPLLAEQHGKLWIGATIVDADEAERDVPEAAQGAGECALRVLRARARPVDWKKYPGIDWIIVGGESTQGAKAREFPVYLALNTVRQARKIGAAPFVKQLGSNVIDRNDAGFEGDGDDRWPQGTADKVEHDPSGYREAYQGAPVRVHLIDRAGADPVEWPSELRVQEFPK